ncbi:MAG: arylamine N-acetyltransferase [Candidatus Neomarinimicrobiota bacterium]
MMYTNSSYEKYLKILKISRRDPSIGALTQLVTAHLTTIPFENISKLYYKKKYSLKTIPDFDLYLEGISKNNFGGTCYSNNYYLNKLLNYLGYDVRLCGADMANPDVHIVNIVSIENRDYLVDVGYAAPFLNPIPLDLIEDYKITLGADEYVISPRSENGYSKLKMIRSGQTKHGYTVKPYSRSISEFETIIKNSFKESSTFLNAILLVMFKSKSSIVIHNFSLIENYGVNFKSIKLESKLELIDNIVRHFKIPKEIVEDALAFITNFEDAWN